MKYCKHGGPLCHSCNVDTPPHCHHPEDWTPPVSGMTKRYTHYVVIPFAGYVNAIIESDKPELTAEEIDAEVDFGLTAINADEGVELVEWHANDAHVEETDDNYEQQ